MPEIVRDLAAVRDEHAALASLLGQGLLERHQAETLAERDDELTRFHALCLGTTPFRLYATGILPGDELRHPMSDMVGRAVTDSRIEIGGETMTLMEATRRVAAGRLGKGPALGEWTGRGIMIGDPMGLWPKTGAPASAEAPEAQAEAAPAPAAKPVNLELPF